MRFPLLVVLGGCCTVACSPREVSRPGRFWAVGSTYIVSLNVTRRAALLPDVRMALGPIADTVSGRLSVARITPDSVFGTHDIEVGPLGVLRPMSSPAPLRFGGRLSGDSIRLLLNSHVTDAGVELVGTASAGKATGTWTASQQSTRGEFRITRP